MTAFIKVPVNFYEQLNTCYHELSMALSCLAYAQSELYERSKVSQMKNRMIALEKLVEKLDSMPREWE